jgi:integrase/recombinase XerD
MGRERIGASGVVPLRGQARNGAAGGAEDPAGREVGDFGASRSGSSVNTVRTYESSLRNYLLWRGEVAIDRGQYDRYILYLRRKGRRQNGIATVAAALREYARWKGQDVAEWQVPRNQMIPVDSLREDEIDRLRAAAMARGPAGADILFVIDFLLGTALRITEFLGLRWSDMDLLAGTCVVREGKGNKSRTLPMTETAVDAAVAYLHHVYGLEQEAGSARLIPDRVLPYASRQVVALNLTRIAHEAGLDARRVHPHLFRHTFSLSNLEAGTMTERTLQKYLGHARLDTTARYLNYNLMDEAPRIRAVKVRGRRSK